MQATNNIVVTAGEPVCRFVKTVQFSISGKRLNPHDERQQQEFILGPRPYATDDVDYDSQVIELYSENEKKFFQFANRYLFARGFLAPYDKGPSEVDVKNVLTDDEIEEIASTRSLAAFTSKLSQFNSKVTVKRIKEAAEALGRPLRFVKAAESYENGLT